VAAGHCSRKIDQVRISVWQRVSEHEDSMQSLLARRAKIEEEYGRRIQEVLSGEEQTNKVGSAKHIEEVMKDERMSRSQNSGTPTKRRAGNHNDQAQMSKSSSSILSAPLPEKGTSRAILAGRLEMEKSRLYDDLSREISALEVAQAQERAALHAAASEILQAVSPQVGVQTFAHMHHFLLPVRDWIISSPPPLPAGLLLLSLANLFHVEQKHHSFPNCHSLGGLCV
jgi:hypothetical protein